MPSAAVAVRVPLPVPVVGLRVSQVALSVADQVKVPPPVLLRLRVWAAGLPPPCCAVKARLIGLAPMAGGTETTGGAGGAGGEDGDINCANPGISAANLLIDRPPEFPFPEVEELLAPTVASGIVPIDAVPMTLAPVGVTGVAAGNGAALMAASGTAAPIFLGSNDGSLG